MSKARATTSMWCEPTQGLDASVLYDAIVLLAGRVSRAERERAARRVLEQVGRLARTRKVTRLLSRPGCRACGDDLIHDAIQHTAIVICSGAGQFRGSNPAMAVAWCAGILRNYLRSEARRRLASTPEESLPPPWLPAAQEAHVRLASLDAQVQTHLRQTRSQRDAASLYRAVSSYVRDLAGGRERLSRGERSTDEQRKARARTYQHHHRARSILAEVREAYGSSPVASRR